LLVKAYLRKSSRIFLVYVLFTKFIAQTRNFSYTTTLGNITNHTQKGMKKEFHTILKFLYNNPNHKHNLTEKKSELGIFDNKKITYISNELVERKLAEKHENITTISSLAPNKFGVFF
jgi:hypothetical protein